jgi:hypothetical protein
MNRELSASLPLKSLLMPAIVTLAPSCWLWVMVGSLSRADDCGWRPSLQASEPCGGYRQW